MVRKKILPGMVTGTTIALLMVGVLPGAAPQLYAQSEDVLQEADDLLEAERPEEVLSLLEDYSGNAEVYWRRAAATLIIGDLADDAGASDEELLEIYARGEAYADEAIAADPRSPDAYYWKSAHIGRWGQTRGILNSLFRASDMRDLLEKTISLDPQHADAFFVLGQLYSKVPGMISFGDAAYGVSLGRRAVDLMEAEVASGDRNVSREAYYVELAASLINRGWNERRRFRRMSGVADSYRSASTPLERGYYYEGSLSLPSRSDEDEAREILQGVIRRMERASSLLPSEERRLKQARELLEGL